MLCIPFLRKHFFFHELSYLSQIDGLSMHTSNCFSKSDRCFNNFNKLEVLLLCYEVWGHCAVCYFPTLFILIIQILISASHFSVWSGSNAMFVVHLKCLNKSDAKIILEIIQKRCYGAELSPSSHTVCFDSFIHSAPHLASYPIKHYSSFITV